MQGTRIPDDVRYQIKELASYGVPYKTIGKFFNISASAAYSIAYADGVRNIMRLPENAISYVLTTHEKIRTLPADQREIKQESRNEVLDFACEGIAIEDIAQHLQVKGWQVCACIKYWLDTDGKNSIERENALDSIARYERKVYGEFVAAAKQKAEQVARKAKPAAAPVQASAPAAAPAPMSASEQRIQEILSAGDDAEAKAHDAEPVDHGKWPHAKEAFDRMLKEHEAYRGYPITEPKRVDGMDDIDYQSALRRAEPRAIRKAVRFGDQWVEILAGFAASDDDDDVFVVDCMEAGTRSPGMSEHQASEIAFWVAKKYLGMPAALWQLVKQGTQLRELP